jgi:RNA polymerase sigma-70 factor (ECF subfamily)
MATLSDQDVISKVKEGELDYFSFVVKKFTPRISNFITSRLFRKEDADDLVQNTFISFYKAISRFNTDKPVLPYLYEIARNELKMYFRSHKPTVPLKEEITVADSEEIIFDETYLNVLGKHEKRYLLEIADGYSYQEVAKKYKMSVNTLKSKIRRARLKVNKAYEEE